MSERKAILMRGYRGGLYITVDDSVSAEELNDSVMERIRSVGAEIRGKSIVLDVEKRGMDEEQLRSFQKLSSRGVYGMSIQEVITKSDVTRGSAKSLRIRSAPALAVGSDPEADTVCVPHTLRSGEFKRNTRGKHSDFGGCEPWGGGVRFGGCDCDGRASGGRVRRHFGGRVGGGGFAESAGDAAAHRRAVCAFAGLGAPAERSASRDRF